MRTDLERPRYAVIGDPIAHSLSPVMQNTFFACMDIPGEMVPIRVAKGGLPAFLSSEQALNMRGFNVTMPHKEAAYLCCDQVDEIARLCRSVNCIVVEKDGLAHGYNTDAEGLRLAVEQAGFTYEDQDILILGAGAVTRSIALSMAQTAKSITFLNRTLSSAQDVAAFVKKHTSCHSEAYPLTTETCIDQASRCTMLINTTPLGMEGVDVQFENLSFLDALPKGAPVIDLIYRPALTALLSRAKEKDHPVMNGLSMLLMQGALSFEKFTGVMPDEAALGSAMQDLRNT